jgi:type I restriction enzyme S subunit
LSSVFPGEWGSNPSPGKEVTSVLRSTNLDDEGHVNLSTGADRHIPQIKLATKELRPGDILLEASGGGPGKPVGRVALFKGGARKHICSNFFRTLRPNSQVHAGYLAWRLIRLYESPGIWNYQQQTTGLINLNLRDYLDQDLAWPPLGEQARIAEVLDTLDEAIRMTTDIIAKRLVARRGLVRDLLTYGVDQNGERRDPRSNPAAFVSSSLGMIPKAWRIKALSSCCFAVVDCPHSTPNFLDQGVLVARTMHIKDGRFDTRLASRVSEEEYQTRVSRLEPGPGDVVLTR